MNYTLLSTIVGLVFSMQLSADNLTQTLNFEQPQFNAKNNYTEIIYPNCHNFGPEGAPNMPHFAAEILLPPGHELISVELKSVEYYPDLKSLHIIPAGRQFPLSQKPEKRYVLKENSEIYNQKGAYPGKPIANLTTQYFAGHAIGGFTFCPVEYFPTQNKAKFVKSVTLKITTEPTAAAQKSLDFLKDRSRAKQRIIDRVLNRSQINQYTYKKEQSTSGVDILLITNEALLPGFEDYITYKTNTGFIVETQMVDDIYATYSGIDNPEKIRNCIIDYYQNQNLKYVVLGGDADGDGDDNIVPTRGMIGDAYGMTDDFIPADIYYSCLDGNWDTDGDGVYGEPDEEDLLAEVHVGRIAADEVLELEKFMNKIIMYQDQPVVEDIEKATMVGELLWHEPTYGGDYKDEVADGASTHGYTSTGFSDNFQINRLYHRDEDWSHQDVYDEFSTNGLNLLNHLGHCNVTYHMTLDISNITTSNFQNDGITRGFVIDYSQGCYCGSFDNRNSDGAYGYEDCFAEEFTNFENGAVACIMNSRYGWAQHSSTDGASQYYDRQFFDAIFGEDITIIGEANSDSKSDNIALISSHEGAMRWCAYELTLFGDPSMDIWTAQPTDMVVDYNAAIYFESSQVSVQTDAPFARIALIQNNSLIGRAVADENGDAIVQLFNPVTSPEQITISVIAHNKNRHQGSIDLFTDAPYVGLDSYTLDAMPDYGSALTMNVKMKNLAEEGSGYDANSIMVKLRAKDNYITITDSVFDLGNLNAGDSISLDAAFAFAIADSVEDQHTVNFEIFTTGNDKENYEWRSSASLEINAPHLGIGDLIIDDSANGNNDGILDAGETAVLKVETINIGHASINEVNAEFSFLDGAEYLTFADASFIIGEISSGDTALATFEVTAEQNTPLGTPVNLEYYVSGAQNNQYNKNANIEVNIGFVPEYCESRATYIGDSEIDEVAFGNVVNNTAGECSGYVDFTEDESLTDEFIIGQTFNISVTLGTCGGDFRKLAKVYIDWNYDGDFYDDGEMVFATPVADSTDTFTETVYVPANTVQGQRFMRVVATSKNSDNVEPCGEFFMGETEDYKIYLVPSGTPVANFEAYPAETTEGDIVEFTDLTENAPNQWSWSIIPGEAGIDYEFVNETTGANKNPQVQFYTVGTYSVELTASNSEGSETELKTDYIVINEVTEVPQANFSIDQDVLMLGEVVQFTDLSTNTPTAWAWSISPGTEGAEFNYVEGTTENSMNPKVQFDSSGFYSIELIASNVIGDSEPFTQNDAVEVLSVFVMSDGTATAYSGMFYDDGGADKNYLNNANYCMTFFPAESGKMLQFNFTEFSVENMSSDVCYDQLTVYNGEDTNAPLIGTYCDNNPAEIITASNASGALTFVFESDEVINQSGWVAEFSCVSASTVTFSVTSNAGPTQGAEIFVAGNSLITDATGEVSILLQDGTYDYSVSMTSFEDSFIVAGEDLFIEIEELLYFTYMVTFHVTANGVPMEGAMIISPVGAMSTNQDGDATAEMEVGTNNFTVILQNYDQIHDSVDVVDGPETVNIDMLSMNNLSAKSIEIYPNPNKGVFLIKVDGTYTLDVMNAMGKVVYSTRITNKRRINLEGAASGVYFIRLHNEKAMEMKRLIINR
ncbi:MAG: C25 family cysteine peptidase [Salinivirgaceae bacterium]|jgi:PKD repeat protein|nr:C25 family cysteine peptidase [Salinivirgaceae bacterium]